MLFFTIKHCQIFTLTKRYGAGVHGGKMYAHDVFFVFLRFDPAFFSPFSRSLPPFCFAISCLFHMLGHLCRALLMFTRLQYEGVTVDRTFLVRKFDHFLLTSDAFRVLRLHARELMFILLLPRILPN